jgi:hypothetical protein
MPFVEPTLLLCGILVNLLRFCMRKPASIALVLLIVFQCMGYLWIHELELAIWQHLQWEAIEEKEVASAESLVLNDLGQVDWENAHEFSFQGERYDFISSTQQSDGKWLVRCISDFHEQTLRAAFRAQFDGKGINHTMVPHGHWTDLLQTQYCPDCASSLTLVLLAARTWGNQDLMIPPSITFDLIDRPPIAG